MYTYALTSSMSARSNLDQKAGRDAYEDANAHYPDGVVTGTALEAHANSLVDQAFTEDEDGNLTDDPEEYRARYVLAYMKAYTEQVASRKQDEEE